MQTFPAPDSNTQRGSELLVVVPTRSRPHNLTRLLRGIAETMTGSADVLVAVDDDDPAKGEYLEATAQVGFAWLEAGPRAGLGPTLNRHATHYAPSYQAIGFMGDDHLPRTPGWDTRWLGTLAELGGAGMVYGNDRLQGPALPTAVAMSSCIIDALGWMVPPGLRHLYLDNAWLELGKRLGSIRYDPTVVIEHLHPVAGKAPTDALYAENNHPDAYARDEAAFHAWRREHLGDDAARVRDHCRRRGGG